MFRTAVPMAPRSARHATRSGGPSGGSRSSAGSGSTTKALASSAGGQGGDRRGPGALGAQPEGAGHHGHIGVMAVVAREQPRGLEVDVDARAAAPHAEAGQDHAGRPAGLAGDGLPREHRAAGNEPQGTQLRCETTAHGRDDGDGDRHAITVAAVELAGAGGAGQPPDELAPQRRVPGGEGDEVHEGVVTGGGRGLLEGRDVSEAVGDGGPAALAAAMASARPMGPPGAARRRCRHR